MKIKSLVILLLAGQCTWCRAAEEMSFQPVALADQPAPGTTNVLFNTFQDVSLADNGQVAFTANISGPGVGSTNDLGLWAGLPGDLMPLVRTGDPVPDATNGEVLSFLAEPNLDNHQAVVVMAVSRNSGGNVSPQSIKDFGYAVTVRFFAHSSHPLDSLGIVVTIPAILKAYFDFEGHVQNVDAAHVTLSGPGVDLSNDTAIVAGPPTNLLIVARAGFPAPGTSTNFSSFPSSPQDLAIAPDGRVVFSATTAGSLFGYGIWFGTASNLQAVAVAGQSVPDTLLGPGYTFAEAQADVSLNDRGEIAFVADLYGPSLNYTNWEFVLAGAPDALRVVAQSGQPAPGISNAFFTGLGDVIAGSDGSVAFESGFTGATNAVFALWLAPSNGAPRLIARSGAHAPGTPDGVAFAANSFNGPAVTDAYLNRQDQIAFRAQLTGPGVGATNNVGIWLAEPDGSVNLVARTGDPFEVAPGQERQLAYLSFGANTVGVAGPDDGRSCPFNDRGEMLISALWYDPPGSSAITGGLFLARPGIVLNAEESGNDLLLRFPTLAGKNYEVDVKTNLSAPSWSPAVLSVAGTGGEVTVTNAFGNSSQTKFYRVVRTD